MFGAAYGGGIYRSADGGVSWTPSSSGLTDPTVWALTVHKGILFAGTRRTGIYRSTDDGDSWEQVGDGVANPYITDFATDGANIFAAGRDSSYTRRIFLSSDDGDTWTDISVGLGAHINVVRLLLTKDSIFAGGNGLWRRPLSEVVAAVDDKSTGLPVIVSLEQNFPNPFNPATEIQYTLPDLSSAKNHSVVTLKVFNLLGEEIATLVNEPQEPGRHSVRWYAGSHPSGDYFYRLQVGGYSSTMKSVLIK